MYASIVERQGIGLETAGHREEREEKGTEKRATRVGAQKGEERVHPREDVLLVVDLIGQENVQKEKEKEKGLMQ